MMSMDLSLLFVVGVAGYRTRSWMEIGWSGECLKRSVMSHE